MEDATIHDVLDQVPDVAAIQYHSIAIILCRGALPLRSACGSSDPALLGPYLRCDTVNGRPKGSSISYQFQDRHHRNSCRNPSYLRGRHGPSLPREVEQHQLQPFVSFDSFL